MILKEDLIPVGKFQKTHALKGELNAILDISPEYFEEDGALIVETDGIFVPYFVDSIRPKGVSSYLVKIKGVESEGEASTFVNHEIFILAEDASEWLPEEMKEENSLIGFHVMDEKTGNVVGKVVDIEDSTVNVLLIVDAGEEEPIYIPLVEDFISGISEEEKIIKMEIPEGLLDINRKNKE